MKKTTNEKTKVIRKLGLNRGKTRLWLEGKTLLGAGWNVGDRFRAKYYRGSIEFVRDPDGPRKVAGTDARPIIDTLSERLRWQEGGHDLLPVLGDTVRVEVEIGRDLILVTPKKEEASK